MDDQLTSALASTWIQLEPHERKTKKVFKSFEVLHRLTK